jgi:hypothetical protein
MELNKKYCPIHLIEEIKSFEKIIEFQIQNPPILKTILENENSGHMDQTSPTFIEDGAKYHVETFPIQKQEHSVTTILDMESPLNFIKGGFQNNSPSKLKEKPHLYKNYDFVREINITSQQNKDLINIQVTNNIVSPPI